MKERLAPVSHRVKNVLSARNDVSTKGFESAGSVGRLMGIEGRLVGWLVLGVGSEALEEFEPNALPRGRFPARERHLQRRRGSLQRC